MPLPVPGVLVFGDTGQYVYFVRNSGGQTIQTAMMLNGQMVAAPAYRGGIAYVIESSRSQSTLHAYETASGVDRFASPAITVPAEVLAAPVIDARGMLYFAASNGLLYMMDVSDPSTVKPLQNLDVMQLGDGTAKLVYSLLLAADGTSIFLVTQTGVYGVRLPQWYTVVGPLTTTAVAWRPEAGLSWTTNLSVLCGSILLATDGQSTLYAYDTAAAPVKGVLPRLWTYTAETTIELLAAMDGPRVQMITADGTLVLVEVASGTAVASVPSALPNLPVVYSLFYDSVYLLTLTNNDGLYVYDITQAGAVVQVNLCWHAALPNITFNSAPFVADGRVYVLGSDSILTVYRLRDGAVKWTQHIAGSSGIFSSSAMCTFDQTATGKIRFLLDGQEYFAVFRDLMLGVLNNNPAISTGLGTYTTFGELTEAIGAAGYKAYVLAWQGSWLSSLATDNVGIRKVLDVMTRTDEDPRQNQEVKRGLEGKANVSVYLDPYPQTSWVNLPSWGRLDTWLGFRSSHQKMVIASIQGQKFALVGGLNISQVYWDTEDHLPRNYPGYGPIQPWHDTAVLLQGAIVDQVEAEFDRRWSQSGQSSVEAANGTYIKVAAWAIDLSTDFQNVFMPAVTDLTFANPTLTSPTIPLQLRLTNYDSYLYPVHQIRDKLVDAIALSQQYVYIENYAIHDATVVKALADRLRQAPPAFRLVVVINELRSSGDQGVLNGYTFRILSLVAGAWTEFKYEARQSYLTLSLKGSPIRISPPVDTITIRRTDVTSLSVNIDDRGLAYTTITFVVNGVSTTISLTALTELEVPDPDANSRLLFSYPLRLSNVRGAEQAETVYVHSKLCLIDDQKAMVGSANFSKRSMLYDGEMSVFIDDPTTVTAIRTRLFQHWGMSTAAQWAADAIASLTPARPLSITGVPQMVLLSAADFPVEGSWATRNAVYFTSYVGSVLELEGILL